jgi:hypothetical protein
MEVLLWASFPRDTILGDDVAGLRQWDEVGSRILLSGGDPQFFSEPHLLQICLLFLPCQTFQGRSFLFSFLTCCLPCPIYHGLPHLTFIFF